MQKGGFLHKFILAMAFLLVKAEKSSPTGLTGRFHRPRPPALKWPATGHLILFACNRHETPFNGPRYNSLQEGLRLFVLFPRLFHVKATEVKANMMVTIPPCM